MDGGNNYIRSIHRRDPKKRNKNEKGIGKINLIFLCIINYQIVINKSREIEIPIFLEKNTQIEFDLKKIN